MDVFKSHININLQIIPEHSYGKIPKGFPIITWKDSYFIPSWLQNYLTPIS